MRELFRQNEHGDTWQEPELFDQPGLPVSDLPAILPGGADGRCPHPGGFRAETGEWECSRCGHRFADYETWGAETGNMAAVRAVSAAVAADLAELVAVITR